MCRRILPGILSVGLLHRRALAGSALTGRQTGSEFTARTGGSAAVRTEQKADFLADKTSIQEKILDYCFFSAKPSGDRGPDRKKDQPVYHPTICDDVGGSRKDGYDTAGEAEK